MLDGQDATVSVVADQLLVQLRSAWVVGGDGAPATEYPGGALLAAPLLEFLRLGTSGEQSHLCPAPFDSHVSNIAHLSPHREDLLMALFYFCTLLDCHALLMCLSECSNLHDTLCTNRAQKPRQLLRHQELPHPAHAGEREEPSGFLALCPPRGLESGGLRARYMCAMSGSSGPRIERLDQHSIRCFCPLFLFSPFLSFALS